MSDHASGQPRRGVPPTAMSAWQRWEMTSITTQVPEPGPEAGARVDPQAAQLDSAMNVDEAEIIGLRHQAEQAGRAQGHQEGYTQGHAEGYAAGLASVQEQAQSMRTLLQALPQALRAAEREVADDLLALALDIARQVVRETLTAEPQRILALVRELLRREPTLNGTPRLLMHVDDAALVQQHLADDLHTAGWRIRTDLSIARGGCRVHAASGAFDATLETRWHRVAAAFARDSGSSLEPPNE